jgi:hypothetical protein
MVCLECRHSNPDDNAYCGKCGAELGFTTAETTAKRGIRDRKAIEYELTEAVADRLKKWFTLAFALFALALGWSYFDFRRGVTGARTEIDRSVEDAKTDIGALRKSADDLKPEIAKIQSDIDGYRQANARIDKIQKGLSDVSQQVLDLSNRDLKVHSISTSGTGRSVLEFGNLGCPATVDAGYRVEYCVENSVLYQISNSGERHPVAARSPVGFQDASTSAKPVCDAAARGTFYVEKGDAGKADKPFVCGKKSNEQYDWVPLGMP